MATNTLNSGDPGFVLPGYTEIPGIQACFAPTSNGKESNPPAPPKDAPNSSPTTQLDGSSLPKAAQGVVANTIISINNAIPAHGCSIKLPVIFDKIEIQFKKYVTIEGINLAKFGTWLGESIEPIVESIKNAVKALKDKLKIIMDYVKKIQRSEEHTSELQSH